MSINVNHVKLNAAFRNVENGDLIHVIKSEISKDWRGAVGKLMYNTINEHGIKASISSIDKFKCLFTKLELTSLNEVMQAYDKK